MAAGIASPRASRPLPPADDATPQGPSKFKKLLSILNSRAGEAHREILGLIASQFEEGRMDLMNEESDTYVRGQLMRHMISAGMLQEALRLFHQRVARNKTFYVQSCRLFARLGDPWKIRVVLTDMNKHYLRVAEDETEFDRESLRIEAMGPAFLYSLFDAFPEVAVDDLFQMLDGLGIVPDYDVFHVMLNALLRNRRPQDVMGVFLRMPQYQVSPDYKSYSFAISAIVNSRDYASAIAMYEGMKKEGVMPDLMLYNFMLIVRAGAGDLREADKLRYLLELDGVPSVPDLSTMSALLMAYSTVGKLRTLVNLADFLNRKFNFTPDQMAWVNLIDAAGSNVDIVRWALSRMREAGCEMPRRNRLQLGMRYDQPREPPLVREFGRELKLQSEGPSQGSAVISRGNDFATEVAASRVGLSPTDVADFAHEIRCIKDPSELDRALEKLTEAGVSTPDLCHAYVSTSLRLNQHDRADAFVRYFMKVSAVDVALINQVIQSHLSHKNFTAALELFQLLRSRAQFRPVGRTFQPFLQAAAAADRPRAALLWFRRAERVGLVPDVYSWTVLLWSYCKVRRMAEAGRIFDEMKRRGVQPNTATHRVLLSGFAAVDDLPSVLKHATALQAARDLDGFSASKILSMYVARGDARQGSNFVLSAKISGGIGTNVVARLVKLMFQQGLSGQVEAVLEAAFGAQKLDEKVAFAAISAYTEYVKYLCDNCRDAAKVLELLRRMLTDLIHPPNAAVLVTMAYCQRTGSCVQLLELLLQHRKKVVQKHLEKVCSMAIEEHVQHKRWDEAAAVLRTAKEKNLQPPLSRHLLESIRERKN